MRHLQTENLKMRRKKTLLEEYKTSDISKLKTSYENEKEDLKTAVDELTKGRFKILELFTAALPIILLWKLCYLGHYLNLAKSGTAT